MALPADMGTLDMPLTKGLQGLDMDEGFPTDNGSLGATGLKSRGGTTAATGKAAINGRGLLSGAGATGMRADVTPQPAGPGMGFGAEIVSGIPEYPETMARPPPVGLDAVLPNPGQPRANIAATKEAPQGSPNTNTKLTVLQQHVAFWDRDSDGAIWPWDTFVGFRRLGFGLFISTLAVPVIHGTFSYPTQKSWIPNPLLPIYMDRMHRTKHGSDSEVYDTCGRFVPEKFEEIFTKFDREGKGGLAWKDIQDMVYHNMNVMDPNGWIAERLEWWVTYLLLKDYRGIVSKDKIRGVYDGSIWETVAAEVEARRGPKWE